MDSQLCAVVVHGMQLLLYEYKGKHLNGYLVLLLALKMIFCSRKLLYIKVTFKILNFGEKRALVSVLWNISYSRYSQLRDQNGQLKRERLDQCIPSTHTYKR